jgi:hypothetical protein
MDIPLALLALLPPAPPNGWPEQFRLLEIAEAMRRRETFENLLDADGDKFSDLFDIDSKTQLESRDLAPSVSEEYPLLRRTARLSYAIWDVISGERAPLQRVLEEISIAERLRYAILRMRLLTGRTFQGGLW